MFVWKKKETVLRAVLWSAAIRQGLACIVLYGRVIRMLFVLEYFLCGVGN